MRIHSLSYLTLSLVLPLSPYLFLYVIPPFLQAPTPPSVPLLTTLSSLPLSRSSSPSSASPYPPLSDYSSSSTPPPPPAWHILQPRQPPVWLQDYVTNCSLTVSAPTSQLSPVGSSTMLPPSHQASYTSPVGVCSLPDALSYDQACLFPEWHQVMEEELQALEANKTWDLRAIPPGKTPIGCRWIFKTKLNPDGTISRYKARLVV